MGLRMDLVEENGTWYVKITVASGAMSASMVVPVAEAEKFGDAITSGIREIMAESRRQLLALGE